MVLSLLYKLVVVEAGDMETVPVTPLPLLSSLPAYADHFALGMVLAVTSVAVAQMKNEPRAVGVIDRRPWLPWLVCRDRIRGPREGRSGWRARRSSR